MQKMKIVVVCSMLSLVLIGVFIWKSENFYADYIFPKLKYFSIFGWLIAYNFPPSDYYVPLASIPLRHGEHTVMFSCKYEGRHDIQIKNIHSNQLWNSGVSVCGQIDDVDEKCYLYFKRDDSRWYGYVDDCNYYYASFLAPQEIPLNKKMRLKVRIAGNVEELLKHHPTATLEIIKCFDK